jgi:F5/8 type C domain
VDVTGTTIWRARVLLPEVGILVVYLLLAAVYTRPLLELSTTRIANDPYDPILNTSILWWNATTRPFSDAWWNAPYFYPGDGISGFTENLVGLSVIASPVFWLTHNPLAAYNVAFFLTWPLSAFGAYLLTRILTRRHDAAFLAGVSFGFSPYRTSEMGHIQMLSSYWLPVALFGLHGFIQERRARWLVVFGVAWLLQSLANGYFIFFGAVLIGLWLLYFCSSRETLRAVPPILLAWVAASLPLVPILWRYQAIHERYGLRRLMSETIWFSARSHGWVEISPSAWLWSLVLPWSKDNLFPGITALILVVVALGVLLFRPEPVDRREPVWVRRARMSCGAVAAVSLAALLAILTVGPWRLEWGGVVIRMAAPYRGIWLLALCGVPFLLWTPRTREALIRRSPFVFYVSATIVMAVLCYGPVMRVGESTLMDPAPYRWLMYLPGFDQLRVPTRFWMVGTMCLAVAAGVGFRRLTPGRTPIRLAAFAIVLVALLADGWIHPVNMAEPPVPWPRVERRDQTQPILELPLGPEWDAAATFRSIWHRRRVVNGVSGYDPPHYAPLMDALDSRDPALLLALASLGSFDVVVNMEQDRDGSWARYVNSIPGVAVVGTDGTRTAYRVPAVPPQEVRLGAVLPVAGVWAAGKDGSAIVDGRLETEWEHGPQRPGLWVVLDVGSVRDIGGITESFGEYARDFSRRQAIDVSTDGEHWEQVWEGSTAAQAFLAAVRGPREAAIRIAFPPRAARFVQLRQIARHRNLWRVAELRAHAPAGQ